MKHLGVMTPFWRYQPIMGEYSGIGLGLLTIPEYISDTSLSFPYRKRLHDKEVPFTDEINLVRFLGGWPKRGNNCMGLRGLGQCNPPADF